MVGFVMEGHILLAHQILKIKKVERARFAIQIIVSPLVSTVKDSFEAINAS